MCLHLHRMTIERWGVKETENEENGLKWYEYLLWSEIWIVLFEYEKTKKKRSGVANRSKVDSCSTLYFYFVAFSSSFIFFQSLALYFHCKHAYNSSYLQVDNKRWIKSQPYNSFEFHSINAHKKSIRYIYFLMLLNRSFGKVDNSKENGCIDR